ncbi:hypothetical protein VNO80_00600 [Phaseolus coccineus]|uniref:Uncharacterized protein n=1 Tax=Phaseolus coccineus TaxID=3886 RepID=A0AAN9NYX6_PHACN
MHVLSNFRNSASGGAAVLQWATRWFASGARVVNETRCGARALCGGVGNMQFCVCATMPRRWSAVVAGLVRGVYWSGAADGGKGECCGLARRWGAVFILCVLRKFLAVTC